MEIQDVLSLQLPFFREALLKEEFANKGQLVSVPAGTEILREGSYVKTVPILLQGLAKVVKQETGGKELLLYYIYPLESCIVSINCGLNDLKSRVKAIAEEDSIALLIPSTVLSDWQRCYPSFAAFILDLYQKRFDDLLDAYNALAFQSLDERLLKYLHEKTKALDSNKINATHQELGDELGTARETISRMLKKLEMEGTVTLHRGWIEVLD